MNKSREILQDIINNFSPDEFSRFFRAKHRSFSPHQESFFQYDDPAFADGLKFGEIQFSPDGKLITCAFKATQSLSERSSRKAQYEKGKKILKDTHSDAGIFIFYDSRGNFRFSLIYPEAAGTRRQWSNFRRFTYFVSPELTNKTFLTRVGDGDFSSLDKIKDAFSVEKVTKEFYEQYRKLFEALVVDLDSNQTFRNEASRGRINTPDFAKKLLGQVVFLYFLQKKGWLGVPQNKPWGEGDKNFISNLYRKAVTNKENFFNDYLEILFYDTLNNANREGADPSFSRYFNCRIPFLNGGLFEPEYDWHGTTIHLDNGVFKNIFEIFDRYNFTVEEESPDDKEVAVDPEMLGKVFENLLEENLRKGKGTYYTPREIVHYMCRESLVNFLVSQSGLEEGRIRALILRHESGFSADEAKTLERLLKDVKVCDPACGSGAFLVGMLNEIIHARLALDPAGSEYALKKETIQNCVYGVDIDPGAVEIAKLRLWLSLVVDYELADIEPLPNLDYKIMCGNSLLEELIVGDESIPLFDASVLTKDKPQKRSSDKLMQMDFLKQDADEYLKILRKLHVEYFHETDTQKKKTLRSRIGKIEMDFIQASVDRRVRELDGRIKNLNMQKPEDRKKNAELLTKKLEYLAIPGGIRESKVRPYFLWHLNFFEVFQEKGGFDVVIANPPYVSIEKFARSALQVVWKQSFKNTFASRGDIYCLFYEQGLALLHENGVLTFISSNKFQRAGYGKGLRELLAAQRIHTLIDFCELPVFAAATDPMIVIVTKAATVASRKFPVLVVKDEAEFGSLSQSLESRSSCYKPEQLKAEGWSLEGGHGLVLVDKLRTNGTPLGEYVKGAIMAGIKTGCNKAFWIDVSLARKFRVEDRYSANRFVKPLLIGDDARRWVAKPVTKFLIYTPRGTVETELGHLKRHLVQWREQLEQRALDQQWFELQQAQFRYSKTYQMAKIVYPDIAMEPRFSLDADGRYPDMTAFSIPSGDHSLVAILNSSALWFFLCRTAAVLGDADKGGRVRCKTQYVSRLPIPNVSNAEKSRLSKLAERAAELAAAGEGDAVGRVEREIDEIVYRLFDLTPEEIAYIERSLTNTRSESSEDDNGDEEEMSEARIIDGRDRD